MKIGVLKEIKTGEKRVAATPEITSKLLALGFDVVVEMGAGADAHFPDEAYVAVGARICESAESVYAVSDLIIKVQAPGFNTDLQQHEIELMQRGSTLISFIWPAQNQAMLEHMADHGITALAMDSVPRISRAQKLDALSSMANIGGYRAVIEASNRFGRFFSGQITAAGKVVPAKVMVIGAGVAGLAAIGTAKSLGAIVRAFDTRPEVKEQILSMDAEFLEIDFEEDGSGEGGYAKEMSEEFIAAEMALFAAQAEEVDIIITTALIPGKPAPKLITEAMVKRMRGGGVIVDLAAEQGGNCELTVPGSVIKKHGISIVGYTDLPSRMAAQSSQLYATNVYNLLAEMCPGKDGKIKVDMGDVVVRGATVVNCGKITWPPPPIAVTAYQQVYSRQTKMVNKPVNMQPEKAEPTKPSRVTQAAHSTWLLIFIGGLALFGLGLVAPASFMSHFTVFVLACFIGYRVVWNVSPSLHTPLMSVTNAISSIIILGALTQLSSASPIVMYLSIIAVFITSINIMGGFSVTQRMLQMFKG